MPQGVSQRGFAELIGVSETAVRKALKAKRIRKLPDGSIDPVAARAAWGASTDPARSRVAPEVPARTASANREPKVRTRAEAQDAISLVARILAEEGMEDDGKGVDFGKARTAELIMRTRQREMDRAIQAGALVDRAMAEKVFFDTAREARDAWQSWPARIGIELADELGVDARTLTQALGRYVHRHLMEMGEPEANNFGA